MSAINRSDSKDAFKLDDQVLECGRDKKKALRLATEANRIYATTDDPEHIKQARKIVDDSDDPLKKCLQLLKRAALCGHKQNMLTFRDWCLDWCLEMRHDPDYINHTVVRYVAAGGQFELLKWCIRQGYPVLSACQGAAESGSIDIMEWLRDPTTGSGRAPWGKGTCSCAAPSPDLLRWLRNPDTGGGVCPWDKSRILRQLRGYDTRDDRGYIAWIKSQPE